MAKSYLARLVLLGQPVPGKNNPTMWVDKKRCPSRNACRAIPRKSENKRVKEYQGQVAKDAIMSMQGARCTKRLVQVKGTIYVKDVAVRDVTNMLESIFDGLQKIVFENDFQIHRLGPIDRRLDRKNPRVELTVWEIEDPVFEDALAHAAQQREKAQVRRRQKTGQDKPHLL